MGLRDLLLLVFPAWWCIFWARTWPPRSSPPHIDGAAHSWKQRLSNTWWEAAGIVCWDLKGIPRHWHEPAFEAKAEEDVNWEIPSFCLIWENITHIHTMYLSYLDRAYAFNHFRGHQVKQLEMNWKSIRPFLYILQVNWREQRLNEFMSKN